MRGAGDEDRAGTGHFGRADRSYACNTGVLVSADDVPVLAAPAPGCPALSLPSGRSADDGMPVGTMLMGPPRTDHRLLRPTAALEAAGVDAD